MNLLWGFLLVLLPDSSNFNIPSPSTILHLVSLTLPLKLLNLVALLDICVLGHYLESLNWVSVSCLCCWRTNMGVTRLWFQQRSARSFILKSVSGSWRDIHAHLSQRCQLITNPSGCKRQTECGSAAVQSCIRHMMLYEDIFDSLHWDKILENFGRFHSPVLTFRLFRLFFLSWLFISNVWRVMANASSSLDVGVLFLIVVTASLTNGE